MVVAELVASGEVVQRREQAPADGIALAPLRLDAVKLNAGLAMGRAVLHRPYVPVGRLIAEDEAQEQERLAEALSAMHRSLDDMVDQADVDGAGDHVDILKTYRMIAQDRGWIRRIREAISTGLTAEGAVVRVQDETRARMKDVEDSYLRERLLDLEDLAYRLLQHLAGGPEQMAAAQGDLPEDAILVARNMGPAELLDYDRERLRGLVLEEGSATSHVAIVARALEIPVLGRVKNIVDRVEAFDRIIVDADNGVCFVRPGEDFRAAFETSMRTFQEKREAYRRERDLPAVSRDGVALELMMNAGLLIDMPHLHESGASGIGLYRTEVPFMVRSDFPDVDTQTDLYTRILDQADGKEVVFRTLDIGGDKVLPYFQSSDEENPAMGWRAIRIAMDRPGLLRTQLRAMLRAAGERPISIMFPMVADLTEFEYARRLLMKELRRAEERGGPAPGRVKVGAMLEVPSLAFQIRALAGRADFLSVGSNDLMQFLFASDRGNPRLDGRYDPLSPPALAFLAHVVREAEAARIPLSVCGEMAGDPIQAMALIGLGLRRLSMAPAAIGPVRTMVRSLDVAATGAFTESLLDARGHSLRARLAGFARDHGVTAGREGRSGVARRRRVPRASRVNRPVKAQPKVDPTDMARASQFDRQSDPEGGGEAPRARVGDILRSARLSRDEDLRDVAAKLRIRYPYLEAIEEGRLNDLPGPTYAIGFVRAYSDYLGLETEDVIARFKADGRALDGKAELVFPEPLPGSRAPGFALLFVALVLGGLVYGGWLYVSGQDRPVADIIPAVPEELAKLIDGVSQSGPANGEAAPAAPAAPPAEAPESPASPSAAPASDPPAPDDAGSDSAPPDGGADADASGASARDDAAPAAPAAAGSPSETSVPTAPTAAPAEAGAAPAAPPDAAPSAASDVASEAALGPTPDAAGDGAAEAAADVGADVGADAGADAGADVGPDLGAEDRAETVPDDASAQSVAAAPVERSASSADATVAAEAATSNGAPPTPIEETEPAPDAGEAAGAAVAAAGAREGLEETAGRTGGLAGVSTEPAAAPEGAEAAPAAPAAPSPPAPPPAPEAPGASATGEETGRIFGAAADQSRVALTARVASWIEVKGPDGQTLLARLLRAGETYRAPDRAGVTLVTGNAGGLEITVDGERAPDIGPLGAVRRNVALDPDKLKAGVAADG
eukprot:g11714.t1